MYVCMYVCFPSLHQWAFSPWSICNTHFPKKNKIRLGTYQQRGGEYLIFNTPWFWAFERQLRFEESQAILGIWKFSESRNHWVQYLKKKQNKTKQNWIQRTTDSGHTKNFRKPPGFMQGLAKTWQFFGYLIFIKNWEPWLYIITRYLTLVTSIIVFYFLVHQVFFYFIINLNLIIIFNSPIVGI
jgi:hypothetical protein